MFTILALHENKHLTDDCVQILNEEWPRSKAARLFSVSKSCSSLPYSLVLVEKDKTVVGYCRLAKVINDAAGVLVESVVVAKHRRGQGLGRRVMDMAEQHAARAGFRKMYLCTKDKQGFYQHLGYSFCKPVNTLGAQMLETCDCSPETNTPLPCEDNASPQGCGSCQSTPSPTEAGPNGASCKVNACNASYSTNETCPKEASSQQREGAPPEEVPSPALSPPPPPPPPPPPAVPTPQPGLRVDWMMKEISLLTL